MIQQHSDIPDEWHTIISASCYVPGEDKCETFVPYTKTRKKPLRRTIYKYDSSRDSWRRGNLRDHVRYLLRSMRCGRTK